VSPRASLDVAPSGNQTPEPQSTNPLPVAILTELPHFSILNLNSQELNIHLMTHI